MKYFVYADLNVIGWSSLESGDPPMGCVSGVFYPDAGYAMVASMVREISLLQEMVHKDDSERIGQIQSKRNDLKLSVRTESGEVFEPMGVTLLDYYDELGETGREVSVIGLHYKVFDKYFSHLREQYDNQWK